MDEEPDSNYKRDTGVSDAVQEDFKQACLFIRDQKVNTDDKLRLYGLFKCATVGVCNTPSPTIFQWTQCAKWGAWKEAGEIAPEDAMRRYVQAVGEIFPHWRSGPL
eukprot:CAMPEP_0172192290 /NCGR_PEP_ID=MMETSP1050-20130122/24237_1 /TAXON_ID=233186 /ORGANISM="Cryptomonas curvata, Strain CCAP979/52" /LENGTH=105 /DNA_ID=CAMNT_0012867559 /DNA_START=98 /DNA_END=411 /DNA_ORIENTATION=+